MCILTVSYTHLKLKDLTSDTHTFTNHNQTDNNNYNFGYFIVQHYCVYRSVSAGNTQSKHTSTSIISVSYTHLDVYKRQ